MKKLFYFGFLFILFTHVLAYAVSDSEWKEQKSTHFIVYYKDVPEGFLERVMENAELYYKEITNNLGFVRYDFWLWDKRAKIYIYPDRDEYLRDQQSPEWSGGIAHTDIKMIKTFPTNYGFIDTVLPHELGHIIFREFVKNNRSIPLWMDEGVACYQELTKRWGADKEVLKSIEDGRFIPIDSLTNDQLFNIKDVNTVNLFYSEAVSLVTYMIETFGKFRFANFCKDLSDKIKFEDAIKKNYPFRNAQELRESWVRNLKK